MKNTLLVACCTALAMSAACKAKKSDNKQGDTEKGASKELPKGMRVTLGDEEFFAPSGATGRTIFAMSESQVGVLVRQVNGRSDLYIKPKSGGEAALLSQDAVGLAADEGYIYYSQSGKQRGLYRVDGPDHAPEKLASDTSIHMAANLGHVFWNKRNEVWGLAPGATEPAILTTLDRTIRLLAAGGGAVYMGGVDNVSPSPGAPKEQVGWISRVGWAGGEASTVVEQAPYPGDDLQVYGPFVYFLSGDRSGLKVLMSARLSGRGTPAVVARNVDAFHVSANGTFAAMLPRTGWGVYRIGVSGAEPVPVGKFHNGRVSQVAADAENVYWCFNGRIFRAPIPAGSSPPATDATATEEK